MEHDIFHHTAEGLKHVGIGADIADAIAKGKAYLESLKQSVCETGLVVTVWRSSACVAVVLDDANGLAGYTLKHCR